jgi:molecular chaperone Hsp33
MNADARISRYLTSDQWIKVDIVEMGSLWDRIRRHHPSYEAHQSATLAQGLMATLLLLGRSDFLQRVQLMIKSSGGIRRIIGDAWPDGSLRGFCDLGSPEAPTPFESPGTIQVMRSQPSGEPYQGLLPLVEGDLGKQLEAYFQQSEQIQASVHLWCDPLTGLGGALKVEPLPLCPPSRLGRLIQALEGLDVVPFEERTTEFLMSWINQGEGGRLLTSTSAHYACRCNRDELVRILRGFSQDEKEHLFATQNSTEIRCDYCAEVYMIRASELMTPEVTS